MKVLGVGGAGGRGVGELVVGEGGWGTGGHWASKVVRLGKGDNNSNQMKRVDH